MIIISSYLYIYFFMNKNIFYMDNKKEFGLIKKRNHDFTMLESDIKI
jgi:hypothetical protein